MYWLHHRASIWRLWEMLEDIFLAFTCQWFIIQNKDLIANYWLNWQRGKQDGQTHSSWLWLTWGHSSCQSNLPNLGRDNIHVLSLLTPVKQSWNSYATIYCDFWAWHCVCSFYKNSNMKALFFDFITGVHIHQFLFIYQGTRNTSIVCCRFIFNVIHYQHANKT